jgi:hypothetical protein
VRYENSLLAIDDLEAASKLCDHFAHRSWARVLNAFARRLNPLLPAIRAAHYGGYYWCLDQAEIATDVMFKTRPQLLAVWPDLVRHAALNMSSEDTSWGSSGASCTRRSRPRWSPMPSAGPRGGGSVTAWAATG